MRGNFISLDRLILTAQSDVFSAMFEYEDFSEKEEPRNITILDIDGECLEKFCDSYIQKI